MPELTDEQRASMYPDEKQLAEIPTAERHAVQKQCLFNEIRARRTGTVIPYTPPVSVTRRDLESRKSAYLRGVYRRTK